VLETNHLFEPTERRVEKCAGPAPSIREVLEAPAIRPTLTYKGRAPRPFKQREELEVEVAIPARMLEILRALGYVEILRFEKTSRKLALRFVPNRADELPKLGRFVEIEGPTKPRFSRPSRLGLVERRIDPHDLCRLIARSVESRRPGRWYCLLIRRHLQMGSLTAPAKHLRFGAMVRRETYCMNLVTGATGLLAVIS